MTVGFVSLNYMVEEDAGLLEVCLKMIGVAPLSQAGFLRVKTLPGSAEGIMYASMQCQEYVVEISILLNNSKLTQEVVVNTCTMHCQADT